MRLLDLRYLLIATQ